MKKKNNQPNPQKPQKTPKHYLLGIQQNHFCITYPAVIEVEMKMANQQF